MFIRRFYLFKLTPEEDDTCICRYLHLTYKVFTIAFYAISGCVFIYVCFICVLYAFVMIYSVSWKVLLLVQVFSRRHIKENAQPYKMQPNIIN